VVGGAAGPNRAGVVIVRGGPTGWPAAGTAATGPGNGSPPAATAEALDQRNVVNHY